MGTNGELCRCGSGFFLGRTTEDLGGIQIFETWNTDDAIHKNKPAATAAEHHVTRSI
jgi:hypothetical protein